MVREVFGAIGEFKPTAILTGSPKGKRRLHAEVSSVVSEAARHAAQLGYLRRRPPRGPVPAPSESRSG